MSPSAAFPPETALAGVPVARPVEPAAFAGIFGGATGFVVELAAFSGPLDLLLHLLREEQIDIADIPIARIADQFLHAIHQLGINQAADYLEMASRLVRLKAQMLLPRGVEGEEWEDPRAELVRRLLEYQQIKEIAHWMSQAAERRALCFARGYLPPPPELPPAPLTLDLMELLAGVERVVAGILHPVLHRVVTRPLDVEGAQARVLALLGEREEFVWTEALRPGANLADLLSLFLALLELCRRGLCRVLQPAAFAPLLVRRESPLPAA
ncbi:MAG TPA: ScpA family protein [Gemmatimonadales bacterium]|jgi:segregation and condensation protein A|nr:ScpA family protein [Gemmatimonadales bacterium]